MLAWTAGARGLGAVLAAVLVGGCIGQGEPGGGTAAGILGRGDGSGFGEAVAAFARVEEASIDRQGMRSLTNESGGLAWGMSYVLDAYLVMFEATGERKYLARFVEFAQGLEQRTDAGRALADHRGQSRVGWSATKYSKNGERVVALAHSGMVVYPLARFAVALGQRGSVGELRERADQYATLAEAALREFDAQWRFDSQRRLGYYVFEDGTPAKAVMGPEWPVPFNQQLAAGRAFLALWRLTGRAAHLEKAEGLARHFKAHLRVGGTGAYEWDYWYGRGLTRYAAPEDVSHGAIDVEFSALAARAGLVFSREDLRRFSGTFYRMTETRDGVMSRPHDAAGRWLDLAEVDCGVYRTVWPYLLRKQGKQHPQVLLGVAKLAKYANLCAPG